MMDQNSDQSSGTVAQTRSYSAEYDQGVATVKKIAVQLYPINENGHATRFSLRKGINVVLAIEKEQVELITVY